MLRRATPETEGLNAFLLINLFFRERKGWLRYLEVASSSLAFGKPFSFFVKERKTFTKKKENQVTHKNSKAALSEA